MILSESGINVQVITQSSGFSTPNRGIRCFYAVNDHVVWAPAYDANTPSASCQDITVTTNGGTLWTPRTLAGLNSLDIANIVAVNASTAWVCMYPATSFLMGQGIYKTTDGGVTWNQQTKAAFSNPLHLPMLFISGIRIPDMYQIQAAEVW